MERFNDTPCQDATGKMFADYHEYVDYDKKNNPDRCHFKNAQGRETFAPSFNRVSEIYPYYDLGFQMHKWFEFDLEKARDWYKQFLEKYSDTEFLYQGETTEPNSWGCVYGQGCGLYSIKEEQLFGYLLDIHNALIDMGLDKDAFEWVVVKHTPGTRLGMHQDEPQWLTVHLPLYTNDKTNWTIGGTPFLMPTDGCYIINSTQPHDVVNYGDTDRIHIYFSIKTSQVEKVWEKPNIKGS